MAGIEWISAGIQLILAKIWCRLRGGRAVGAGGGGQLQGHRANVFMLFGDDGALKGGAERRKKCNFVAAFL